MKKIGIFGGTFDPIHFGHIHIALSMQEIKALDEVWFCPAHKSPHKLHKETSSPHHRLEMLKLALADVPRTKIIENELKRDGPSYMVDTLKELLVEHPDCHFGLILGEDAAAAFHQWREPEVILTLADLYIASRTKPPSSFPEKVQNALVPLPSIEISSTVIRSRLSQNLYCGHLLPTPVLHYATSHHLYTP